MSSLKYVVKIGGKDITQLAPVDYIETFSGVNKIPYAIIRFKDWLTPNPKEKLLTDESAFKVGSTVVIEVGDDKSTKPIFHGIVAKQGLKMDAENCICYDEIIAKDKANCLTIADHVISFKDKTDDEILKSIISNQGLSADVSGLNLKHESFTQYNLTDWDLINIRAEVYGRVVLVDDGKVSVVAPKSSGGSPTLTFGEDITSMDLEVNADYQIKDITGKVWDIKSQKIKDVKGNQAPESSFGSVKYSDLTKSTKDQKSNLVQPGINTEKEVKNAISGNLALNRFSKIQGWITVEGNSSVKPNTCVKINKGSSVFQGNAYVSGVKHIIDEDGWVTKISIGLSGQRYVKKHSDVFLPDNSGISSSISGLQIGTVKKLDGDPEKQSRIFVNIPTIHDNNGGVWCRVASLYASNQFGVMFFPEVGDEVVVGFLGSDPRYPVVVGSLFSSKNASPEKLEAKNEIKMLKTKSGMILKFEEKDKIVSILTPGKRSVVISDKGKSINITNDKDIVSLSDGTITLKCNKDITLDGKNITLKAKQNINLKAAGGDVKCDGNNVKLNGKMTAELKGGASATLQSSGNTVVKGTVVNIN